MKSNEEILKEAHERYQKADNVWGNMKQRHTEVLKFIAGDQWTDTARQNFENNGFAAITSNRIPTFLRQITNELRKNVPTIQIDPKEDSTVQTAKVLDDIIRNIQLDSKATTAYVEAAEAAASVGVGYIRVCTEYESDTSMEQKLVINGIVDTNTVMLDPDHKGLAGEDMEYAFISTGLSKDEYRRRYGKSKLASEMQETGWSSANKPWTSAEQIIIQEYFFKDYQKKTLYQTFNTLTSQTETTYEVDKVALELGYLKIVQQREVQVPIVRWTKLNDIEVLEESIWPGQYIPIIPVKGDEYWLDGKRKLVGAVEPAIDAQVMLNYNLSLMAQLIQMAPKAPYIGTAAQFKTYEQEWANINVSNQAFMTYNKDEGAPPPARDLGEVPIQNMGVLVNQAQENLKSIFGVFDPSNQAIAPESGKAILARQAQQYNSNYHFYDNLARSIQHIGCIIVEALPIIYDNPRQVQASTPGGEKRNVAINTPDENGEVKYDMTKGTYAVSIQTGASFGTKRQEAVIALTDIMNLNPQMAQNLADLAIQNMDIPGAKEAAARARAMVDPNVLAASTEGDEMEPAQVAQQLKIQVAQLTKENEAHKAVGEQITQELKISQQENKLIKMSQDVDMMKAELDFKLKTRDQDIEEATTELEFLVKQKELAMAEEELELKKAQLAISGVKVMNDMDSNMLEVHERREDRNKDKVSVSEVMADPDLKDLPAETLDSGMDNEMGNTLNTTMGDSLGGKFSQ